MGIIIKPSELDKIEKSIEKLIKLLDDNIGKIKPKGEYLSVKIYLFRILKRIHFSWDANYYLIKTYNHINCLHPIHIISRNIMMDSLTTNYLISNIEFDNKKTEIINDEKFLFECKRLDCDFVKAKFDIMNLTEREIQVEMKKIHDEQKNNQSSFIVFDKKENKYKYEKGLTKILIKSMKRKENKNSENAYYIYKYLSQHEHFSIFSDALLTEFENQNILILYQSLIISIIEMINIINILDGKILSNFIAKQVLLEIKTNRDAFIINKKLKPIS